MSNERKLEEIERLRQFADETVNPNVKIILLSLAGALLDDDDGVLTLHVQNIVKEVLIPKSKKDKFRLN
ncbi:hypothetical protein D0T49_03545 [Paludibacter sp. 221]|uniref:hypothetical protein n=1 Tax=Paludibacter sp. 221 TaxID=2302939 RepID=UPI0013CFF339|nr:hypothetical protein [Paludibacter sp. 221]NDV46114.1 hypothetical protein [Paludibacter sp. 221]